MNSSYLPISRSVSIASTMSGYKFAIWIYTLFLKMIVTRFNATKDKTAINPIGKNDDKISVPGTIWIPRASNHGKIKPNKNDPKKAIENS